MNSFLDDYFGSPTQTQDKRPYSRKFTFSKDNQKIVIFSDPVSSKMYQIIVELRDSARFICYRIKNMIPVNPLEVFDFSEKYCKCLKIKTSNNPEQVLSTFFSRLKQNGYELTGDGNHQHGFYLREQDLDWI